MRVLLLGAGGHARPLIETLRAAGHEPVGLLDDKAQGTVLGVEVLGPIAALEAHAGAGFAAAVAIGDNALRQRLGQDCRRLGFPLPALVHPAALVSPSARLGPGAQVMARAVIGPEAVLAAHVLVNTGAVVEHECVLAEAVHLGPGAVLCGGVRAGERALLGAGAVVRPGLRIGADSVVAAGAAVAADVADSARVGGVPARPL